jgi:Fe-S-cluster-containing hydrogenase component 2
MSRIKVMQIYEIGIDGPIVCQQCQERFCLKCPEEALSIGHLGQIIHSPTVCTLCGVCEKACPIGAIELFQGHIYVCDLCGGRPKCVEACTEGAIIIDYNQKPPSFKKFKAANKGLNPSEKRMNYLKNKSSRIRTEWRRRNA